MCLGDFVSGLPPLSLFHFLARRPLPARLIAKSLCPSSSRAPKQDPDPAITGHACGRRKHKLGAQGVVGGRGCLGRGKLVHSSPLGVAVELGPPRGRHPPPRPPTPPPLP